MVSPRTRQNEERRLSIRIEQHLPTGWIRTGRGRTRVISGEGDRKWPTTRLFEIHRTAPSVIAVRAHPCRHRHAHGVKNRRDRTRYSADVRVPLTDVVYEGCLNCPQVIGSDRVHATSNVDGVPLIGRALRPEQLGATSVEMIVHKALIPGTRWLGAKMPEEASNEMADSVEASGHEAACLHLTQRRTAGRY